MRIEDKNVEKVQEDLEDLLRLCSVFLKTLR